MCNNKKFKKLKALNKEILKMRGIMKRFKVSLFLLFFAIVLFGFYFFLNSMLTPYL